MLRFSFRYLLLILPPLFLQQIYILLYFLLFPLQNRCIYVLFCWQIWTHAKPSAIHCVIIHWFYRKCLISILFLLVLTWSSFILLFFQVIMCFLDFRLYPFRFLLCWILYRSISFTRIVALKTFHSCIGLCDLIFPSHFRTDRISLSFFGGVQGKRT